MRTDCINSGLQMYDGDMIETYKILNSIYDSDVSPYLEPVSIQNTRDHSKKLNKRYFRINIRKNLL